MPRASTYLNFPGNTGAAFAFYKTVFGTGYSCAVARFGDGPVCDDMPPLSEADKNLVLHVELPILGGHVLMGTNATGTMGRHFISGNNVHINLEPDTRTEANRLFAALSEGGEVEMPLQDMFWGDYFAAFSDKFGTHWMINCSGKG